jgi:hypothetical protein
MYAEQNDWVAAYSWKRDMYFLSGRLFSLPQWILEISML